MNKDLAFRKVEKMLYEYRTYDLAIKNLRMLIDTLHTPSCISNYSSDPVSYTIGNTGDQTGTYGMKRAECEQLETYKARLLEKETKKRQIEEAVGLFDSDEIMIWTHRYLKGQSIVSILFQLHYSRTSYFRIRKNMVLKVMRCIGEL